MTSFQDPILRRTLPISVFEELCSLWRQLVNIEGKTAILVTDEIIPLDGSKKVEVIGDKTFYLLLSSQFRALLKASLTPSSLSYQVSITWDTQAIATFLEQLFPHLGEDSPWCDRLTSYLTPQLTPSTPLHTYFNHRLFGILVPEFSDDSDAIYGEIAVCKPVEDALRQQIAQEQLLNQVIGQIRQSLELSVILETAVRELRNFLQVDRLVIYEFGNKSLSKYSANPSLVTWGQVTYESRVASSIPSLINVIAEDNCFAHIPQYQKKYRQGAIVAIEDVQRTFASSACLTKFLEKYWILSKLIAPIILDGNLWGLLIAHQCFKKRQWLENEKIFLGQIAEHLAVAIYQAKLYAQVQEQKKTVEKRVIERTQELRDTLKASQAANHSKSEFLGNMSHELRTPLTCIIGLSSTLLHWSGEKSTLPLEKQQKYLKTIQQSGKNLLEIINEILEYSKLQAGKYVLAIREFSLSNAAKNVIQRLVDEAEHRRIHLELDLQIKDEEDNFYADPERVQQILYHLLNNALKFTPQDGTVILRLWQENNHAIFQIEDTGIGIKQEQIPLLFESFQQLENSRRRTYGGTGLGLALTQQLVELHGGTIEVESVLNEGSIFTVRLPNQPQRQIQLSSNKEQTNVQNQRNRTIVLVESNEEIATLVGELLTAANYQFIWLMDSVNIIKKLELLQPSLVMLDQDLFEAFKMSEEIKQSAETKNIKVLLLSHKLSSQEWSEISQKGIDDYLIKPIQPNLLLKRVNALMLRDDEKENDTI